MPEWPANLRFCPVTGSYSEEPDDAILRTDMDAGPAKTRRRFTAVPTNISFALPWMTRAEFIQFKAWYENDLGHGALAFDATHPITRAPGRFRFRKPYRMGKAASKITIQIEVELLP